MTSNKAIPILPVLASLILTGCSEESAPEADTSSSAPPPAETNTTKPPTVTPPATGQDRLRGVWRDTSDPFSTIEFEGSRVIFRYAGENYASVQDKMILFVTACEDLTPDASSSHFILTEESNAAPECYRLLTATPEIISYRHVMRGTKLSFEPAR